MKKRTLSLTSIFLIFYVFLLVIFVFIFPPFQKPDEILHFKRAWSLALGQISCVHDSSHSRGYFSFPRSVDTFPEVMMTKTIIMNTEGKFPLNLYKTQYTIGDTGNRVELSYNCRLPFPGYIAQSLGILSTLPFDNLLFSFFTARLFSAVFFIICLIFALRMIPSLYKPILIFSSLLPMTLQQVTAVSYDGVTISLSFLLFAWFIRFLSLQKTQLKEYVLFYCILCLLLFTKSGYYLFGVILFLPLIRLKLPLIQKIIIGVVSVVGIICIAWYSMTLPI